MYNFFVGFFVAAFVCGVLFLCGGVAEAAVMGASPAVLAPAIHPLAHFALWVVTAIALFL